MHNPDEQKDAIARGQQEGDRKEGEWVEYEFDSIFPNEYVSDVIDRVKAHGINEINEWLTRLDGMFMSHWKMGNNFDSELNLLLSELRVAQTKHKHDNDPNVSWLMGRNAEIKYRAPDRGTGSPDMREVGTRNPTQID